MLSNIPWKWCVVVLLFLTVTVLAFRIGNDYVIANEINEPEEQEELDVSDTILLDLSLQKALGVNNVFKFKAIKSAKHISETDSMKPEEVWKVYNGKSIPEYMLMAKKQIEKRKGKVLWMYEREREKRALLKYQGRQGVYPIVEIRLDSLYRENASKLAVVFAISEKDTLLKNKKHILQKLDFPYSLLIPVTRVSLLDSAKSIDANIVPWIPMESSEFMWHEEKANIIPLGIEKEKDLHKKLNRLLKDFKNVEGIASFHGDVFLSHRASVERLVNVLSEKKWWFWDLSKKGGNTLMLSECSEKEINCRRSYLEQPSEVLVKKALNNARKSGNEILLLPFSEKSLKLVENLPKQAQVQGTQLTFAGDIFIH